MNQKIYFWFLRTAFLASMLLQIQAMALAKNSKPTYSNYLLDKDVKEFPRIRNNHQDVFQLVSHGKPGYLLLDGRWRNAKDIAFYLQKHHLLSPSINHINIYGCDFAKGDEGANAIEYLSKTLNVTIAASNNITGKNGDWTLEVGVPHFALSEGNYLYNLQDFDNDGVSNVNDVDADNDGILNAVESPTCFYTAAQAAAIINVTTELQQKNGYFISYNFDNDLSTQSAFNENQSIANKTLFQITPALPIPLKSLYVEMGYWNISYDAASTFKLQGYNGTAWIDLSTPMANTNTTSFTMTNAMDTVTAFTRYRIQGVAGTCWAGGVREITLNTTSAYNPSLHPKATCIADLDADSSPNYLDLDSDGDGCSDALESGATNNNTANYQFSGAVGTNGLVNSLETAPDNGILNYQGNISYAYTAAIKACKDSDSDGVYDVKDIDADNDGILNALESPSCFYSGIEAAKIIAIRSDLTPYDQVNYVAAKAIDNNTNTHAAFVGGQSIANKVMWEVTPALAISAKSMDFDMGGANISYDANSTFKLQGYNGSTWVDLSAPIAATTNADFSLYNTMDSVTAFSKYRALGVAGTCWVSDVNELYLTPSDKFNSSINPKLVCSNDADGDNTPNYLDLDSDGDGCSDALESGATTNSADLYKFTGNVGTNGLVDSLETAPDNGITTHYLPYLFYAQTPVIKACKDLDGDGIKDVKDLDVDNDGILNAPESPTCFYSPTEAANLVTIRSDLQSYDQTNYLPKFAIDDNVNTHSAFSPNQSIANKTLLEFTSNAPIPLQSVYVDVGGSNISTNTSSTFKLQGFTGSTWIDLSTPLYNVNSNDFSIVNTVDTVNLYSRFRIYGVAGTCWIGDVNELSLVTGSKYVPSINPKPVCINDIDGDGVVSYQDLDSDGDGCSDALEAGTTTSPIADYQFTGPVGNNGLVDSIEITPDGGITVFTLPYLFYAYTTNIKVCKDSDNDGIADVKDIDADNDGILNASESPSCFYSAAQAADIVAVTTDLLPYDQSGFYSIDKCIDDNVNTHAAFTGNQSIANKTMWELTPAIPIPLTSVNFDMGASNISYNATSTFKLQGFNGASWIDLSAPVANTTSTDFSIYNTLDTINLYSKFRIYGVAGTCWISDVNEFSLNTTPAFSPSLNPRLNCVSDKDSDGVVNYLDLDSDGDGCSDAFESGATTNTAANYQFTGAVGVNGYVDSLETVADNGIPKKYLPYLFYAYSKSIRTCIDQDLDGIKDVADIDADNDGILNASEASSCFYTISEASTIINVTSDLIPYDQTNYLPKFSYDANVNTHSAFTANQNITNKTLWEISPAIPVPLAALNFDLGGSNISFNNTSTFKLQGFNGSNWLDLSAPTFNINNTDFSITNTIDTITPFSKYRIYGVSGTCWIADINEFTLTPPTRYVPSLNPKQDCNSDVDTDGVVSYLDLDADGDGCSDALEAGATNNATPNFQFTGPVGTNGLVDSLETVVDNGITKYKLPFLRFAQTSLFKGCTDFDGDGVFDVKDIDVDNDGIRNIDESASCFYSPGQAGNAISITTDMAPYDLTATYVIQNAVDHNTNTQSSFAPNQSIANKTMWQVVPTIPVPIKALSFDLGGGNISYNQASTFKLQGFDGVSWTDLSGPIYNTNNTDFNIVNTVDTVSAFDKFRVVGITGTCWTSDVKELSILVADKYVPSINPADSCVSDADHDNIPNYLDLDSDGDGCSDAFEGGATHNNTAAYQFTGAVGNNGYANILEDSTDNGVGNFVSSYLSFANTYSIKLCQDFDNDGIGNVKDIDADNDGILNEFESPSCFYSPAEAAKVRSIRSDLLPLYPSNTYTIDNAYDGNVNTQSAFTASQNYVNKTLYEIIPLGAIPLRSVNFDMGSWNISYFNSNTFKLQGYNGTTWVDLSVPTSNTNTSDFSIQNTLDSVSDFQAFRIYGIDGTCWLAGVNEITLTASNAYKASLAPKAVCVSDNDGDGQVNYLDNDSDGDGCSDAFESDATTITSANYQFSGAVGANGLANSLETAPESGVVNFTSKYSIVAANSIINKCTDTDGDGIPDYLDIDDDNDGILDSVESDCGVSGNNGVSGSSYLYNYGHGVRLRMITNNITGFYADTFNTLSNVWTGSVGGTPSVAIAMGWGSQITFSFEDLAGNPVVVSGPVVSIDKLGTAQGTTQGSAVLTLQNNVNWAKIAGSPDFAVTNNTAYDGGLGSTFPSTTYQSSAANDGGTAAGSLQISAALSTFTVVASKGLNTVDTVDSFRIKVGLCYWDDDEDGIQNAFDLDSDGDGCTDAKEADTYNHLGVTASAGTVKNGSNDSVTSTQLRQDAIINGPYGNNGFANVLQATLDTNAYKYAYTYDVATNADINSACTAKPDTITIRSLCPTCPVSACMNHDEVDTAGAVYSSCGAPAGYSMTNGALSCFAFTPNGTVTDTARSCIVICNGTLCDTTYLIIAPPVTPDTARAQSPCPTCPVVACVVADDIIKDSTTTYFSCGLTGGDVTKGTLVLTLNGCLIFQGNGSQTEADTIKTCVIACSHGICDTTYAFFAPAVKPYGTDSVYVAPPSGSAPAIATCPTADDIQPGYVNPTYRTCGITATDSTFGSISYNATGCVTWVPNGNQNDTIKTCVAKCADTTIAGLTFTVCDTTRVFFVPTAHSDTIVLRAACPSCIVTACPTADDIVVTSATVFGSCGTPFGYSVVPATSAAGCVKFTSTNPASPPTDTLFTCMIACNGTTCDTTYVIFLPPVTSDTLWIAAPCTTCPVTACVIADDVDTSGGTSTYTSCDAPAGYTVTSLNGCNTYTPTTSILVETQSCIVKCNKGICDTTIVILAPPMTPDTVIVTANCPTCSITACVVADEVDTAGATYSTSCAAPAGFTATSSGGCFTYVPSGPYTTGILQTCIVACNNGRCDTTIVLINPPTPVTADTVIKVAPCDTCSMSACIVVNDVDPNGATYSSCGTPAGYTVTTSNNCYIYTPIGIVTDTAVGCITMCNSGKCDTTRVILVPINNHTTPDTLMRQPYCGVCAVNACVSTTEVDTSGASYATGTSPAGYSMTMTNGCASYTPIGTVTDTARTSITICNNGKCDTTFIIIAPPITSLPSDSIIVTFTCDTCSSLVCPSMAGLDTTGGVTYSTCGTPAGYNLTGPDANGCYTFTPTAPHTDTARTCLKRCANGLCDTSYITLIPYPTHTTPDTVILKPTCGICAVNTCVSTAEVSATGATYTNCVPPPGYTVSSSGGCSIYTPSGTITDTVKTCITICNNGRCDTTIVLIAPPRTSLPPDSISVTFSCDTCAAVTCPPMDNAMDTTGGVTYTTCGTPNGYTMVGPDANGCYIVTPIPPNADTAQTCIIRCANGLCDTSYVTLMKPSQPLSILVTSFTGKPLQNRTNQLNWAVSNEKDMDKYAIERSADQKVWNNLGTIAALNKGNNPTFQMIDNNPESSSFYRLVLRDAAGAVTFYPKIVHVQRTDALFDDVKVYPNPAKSIINMDYNSVANRAKVVLYVTDIAGRVIKTMEAEFHMGNNTLQIDISDLADGSYLIDYHNVYNGNTGKVKFVKNAQ